MDKTKQKLESSILENLSVILNEEVDNPSLENITLTDVRLNGDNSEAIIYVSTFGDENLRDIKKAGSFLRQKLSQVMSLKSIPYLKFENDTLLDEINQLDKILEEIT
jgi:ribosome-binding factor A